MVTAAATAVAVLAGAVFAVVAESKGTSATFFSGAESGLLEGT